MLTKHKIYPWTFAMPFHGHMTWRNKSLRELTFPLRAGKPIVPASKVLGISS